MLLLDTPYHGYYLHCRSPHPHADVDMLTMTKNLKMEERNESSGRCIQNSVCVIKHFPNKGAQRELGQCFKK